MSVKATNFTHKVKNYGLLFTLVFLPGACFGVEYQLIPYSESVFFEKNCGLNVQRLWPARQCELFNCRYVIRNDKKETVYTGEDNGFISRYRFVVSACYQNVAWLLIEEKTDSATHYKLINSNGKISDYASIIEAALARAIAEDGTVYEVNRDALYKNGVLLSRSPQALSRASIFVNPSGDMSLIALTRSLTVLASNGKRWLDSGIAVADDSDRMFAAYADEQRENIHYGAVYVFDNSFCKGLKIYSADFGSGKVKSGWLINSENSNIGRDPDIRMDNDTIYVSALNSSVNNRVDFALSAEDFNRLESDHGGKLNQRCGEKPLYLTLGLGVSQFNWPSNKPSAIAPINYKIPDYWYSAYFVESEIGGYRFMAHLMRAESGIGDTVDNNLDSAYIHAALDFAPNNEFYPRIEIEKFSKPIFVDSGNGILSRSDFSAEFLNARLLLKKQAQLYFGAEYSDRQVVSKISYKLGDATSRNYVDLGTQIQSLSILVGTGGLAEYARRYENRVSRFYFQGDAGLGFFNASFGEDVVRQAATDFNRDVPDSKTGFCLNFEAEFGYYHQIRSTFIRHGGASVTAGVKSSFRGYLTDPSNHLAYLFAPKADYSYSDLNLSPFIYFSFFM